MRYEIRYRYSSRGRNTWLVYADGKFIKSFPSRALSDAFVLLKNREKKA